MSALEKIQLGNEVEGCPMENSKHNFLQSLDSDASQTRVFTLLRTQGRAAFLKF